MAIPQNQEFGIRSHYKPSKKEHGALEHVYTRKQRMSDARGESEKKWESAEKQYECYRRKQDLEEWQSDIYIPVTTSIVEALLSEIVDLNLMPLFLPQEPQDKSAATVMNHVFKHTWEIGDGDVEFYKVLKDTLLFGTGIAQEYYRREPRTVKELTRFELEKGIEEYEEREITDYDDVYMECVKLHDFFVDERARGFRGPKGARDCARRYVMHIDDFKNFFKGPIWDHLRNAKYVVPGGDTNYYEFYQPPQGMGDEEVEVLWYWNKPDDRLIIVANDVVVRNTPNPYKHKQLPFARAVDMLNPHQFYGKGEAELLEGLQEEFNTVRRMLMDRSHLDIDKMFLVSNREVLDEEQLVKRPHGIIEVEDPQTSIKPLEYGDVARSTFEILKLMREDTVRVTGYDDRMQALRTPGTATEAAILKESSLRRVRAKVFMIGKMFLINIGRLRMANIQQYYSLPKVERIIGEKGSREYREQVADAKRQERYRNINGDDYEEKFRTIRIEDRLLEKNKDGEVVERPYQGWTFFEADPDSIRGNLDISITAGPILPISKPLLQQRTEMLAQHPVITEGVNRQIYDIVKIGDALLKAHDFSPDDFKTQEAMVERGGEPTTEGPSRVEREVELASIENEEMMKGKALAPTPYVTNRHSEIHLAFMNNEEFMSLPNDSPVVKNFATHVAGELEAQRRRGPEVPQAPPEREGGGGILGRIGGAVRGLLGGGQKQPRQVEQQRATIPAKVVGSEQTPKVV